MSTKLDQFWQAAKAVNLTDQERADIKQTIGMPLGSFAQTAQDSYLTRQEFKAGRARFKKFMRTNADASTVSIGQALWNFFHMKSVATVLIAAIIVGSAGGGLAYAAEDALPGDTLYTMKVDVVEPIRERFTFGDHAKANWAKRRMEKRLAEVEAVLEKGKMPAGLMEKMQTRIERHNTKLEHHLERLGDDDRAVEMRERMEERLEKNELFMQSLEAGSAQPEEVLEFIQGVKRHRKHHRDRAREHKKRFRQRLERDPIFKEAVKEAETEVREEFQEEGRRLPPFKGSILVEPRTPNEREVNKRVRTKLKEDGVLPERPRDREREEVKPEPAPEAEQKAADVDVPQIRQPREDHVEKLPLKTGGPKHPREPGSQMQRPGGPGKQLPSGPAFR